MDFLRIQVQWQGKKIDGKNCSFFVGLPKGLLEIELRPIILSTDLHSKYRSTCQNTVRSSSLLLLWPPSLPLFVVFKFSSFRELIVGNYGAYNSYQQHQQPARASQGAPQAGFMSADNASQTDKSPTKKVFCNLISISPEFSTV